MAGALDITAFLKPDTDLPPLAAGSVNIADALQMASTSHDNSLMVPAALNPSDNDTVRSEAETAKRGKPAKTDKTHKRKRNDTVEVKRRAQKRSKGSLEIKAEAASASTATLSVPSEEQEQGQGAPAPSVAGAGEISPVPASGTGAAMAMDAAAGENSAPLTIVITPAADTPASDAQPVQDGAPQLRRSTRQRRKPKCLVISNDDDQESYTYAEYSPTAVEKIFKEFAYADEDDYENAVKKERATEAKRIEEDDEFDEKAADDEEKELRTASEDEAEYGEDEPSNASDDDAEEASTEGENEVESDEEDKYIMRTTRHYETDEDTESEEDSDDEQEDDEQEAEAEAEAVVDAADDAPSQN